MNGQIGQFMLYPDQMSFINAALILLFIPIFDKGIYPLAAKCGLLKTPLQKIITGGVLLAISFLIRDHFKQLQIAKLVVNLVQFLRFLLAN